MIKNRCFQFATIVACLALLSSCASPYIGRHCNTNNELVCTFQSFPSSCSFTDENFSCDYQIEKTDNPDEYKISGTVQYIGGQTFMTFSGLSFTLLLVNNSVVVETFGIAGGSGLLQSEITFSRTFVTPLTFDASLIDYQANARG